MRRVLSLSLLGLSPLLGCVIELPSGGLPVQDDSSARAPLDGTTDVADRECNVVLREVRREKDGTGNLVVRDGGWLWRGTVDVPESALSSGATVHVLARMGPSGAWRSVPADVALDAPADDLARFAFVLDRSSGELPGPGWSATAISRARLELIPYLALPSGGRRFDHNRPEVSGDLDVYALANESGFALPDRPDVCAPPAPPAVDDPDAFAPRLRFYEDGGVEQAGGLIEGAFFVEYDQDRLTGCRGRRNGREAWSLTAWALYLPSGKTEHAAVVAANDDASAMDDVPARFEVPAGTTTVELWFQNNSLFGCNALDSRYGDNYAFDVLSPPAWSGDVAQLLTRSSGEPCHGAALVDGDVVFDSWARTRAVRTELCFDVWEPGVTDLRNPDLWRQLDVQARYRVGGGLLQAAYVPYVARVGDDARYAFDLRALDPLAWPACPESADVVEGAGGDLWRVPVEVSFVVNGEEVPGGPVRVIYEDAVRAGCGL